MSMLPVPEKAASRTSGVTRRLQAGGAGGSRLVSGVSMAATPVMTTTNAGESALRNMVVALVEELRCSG